MKVIWQNNKALQIESQNVGCGPNISSRHVLAKSRGPHPLPQEPYKEDHRRRTVKTQSSAERSQECHQESGDVFKQLLGSQSAESWNPSCRVCGRAGELQDLENCDQLLQNVFGVMVQCASAKVCNDCAELMQHTQRFKNMVCAAFQHSSETSTLKNEPSVHSIANKKGSDLKERGDTYITAKTSKRKTKLLTAEPANKKIIAACTVCSQKYAMPRTSGDFVCSRCKLTNSNEKTVTCVKCRSKVPSTLIKDHLEIHAQANLKGRFRSVLKTRTQLIHS
ncbi:hypothetical protein O0L34_g6577 [Tuta absoluta]|nr:hypothetical protein O0L34_g6577 [Tuta absoluta]